MHTPPAGDMRDPAFRNDPHTVLPAGGLVFFMTGAANRDPAVFAEPDRFDIMRSPNPPSHRSSAS